MNTVCDRDWPEDFEHENGEYMNTCCECKNTFTGHKRRFICKACSTSQGGEAVAVVAHMYQHEETGLVGFVDQQQVDWGFEKNNPRLHLCGELMTVAQHQRIMAASVGSAEPVGVVLTEEQMGIGYDRRIGPVLWFGSPPPGEKLYTHPADQVADDLTMVKVPRELLERLASPQSEYALFDAQEELLAVLAKP